MRPRSPFDANRRDLAADEFWANQLSGSPRSSSLQPNNRHTENSSSSNMTLYNELVDEIGFTGFHTTLLLLAGGATACEAVQVLLLCFQQKCISEEWHLDAFQESLITSSVIFGQFIGLVCISTLADNYGRRTLALVGMLICCIFSLLSVYSWNLLYLLFFRTIVGLGLGTSHISLLDLVIEVIPVEQRHKAVYLSYLGLLGEVYVIFLSWISLPKYGWRTMTFFAAVPSVILFIYSIAYLPESPLWLFKRGRHAEAVDILKRQAVITPKIKALALKATDASPRSVDNSSYKNIVDIFKPSLVKITLSLELTWLFTQFVRMCGILIIIDYFSHSSSCTLEYKRILLMVSIQLIGIGIAIYGSETTGKILIQSVLLMLGGIFAIFPILLTHGQVNSGVLLMIVAVRMCIEGSTSILALQTPELYATEVSCYKVTFYLFP